MTPLASSLSFPRPPHCITHGELKLHPEWPKGPRNQSAPILLGGGDAPGMNAAVRGFAIGLRAAGWKAHGVLSGWAGLVHGSFYPLDQNMAVVDRFYRDAGAFLGTGDRKKGPFDEVPGVADPLTSTLDYLREFFDGWLFVVGGNGSIACAERLLEAGAKVLVTFGTIDRDGRGVNTIGFDTATEEGVEALGKLRATGSSCAKVHVLEVMGAKNGALALNVAVTGEADFAIIPEEPTNLDDIIPEIRQKLGDGGVYTIVVAEGANFSYRTKKGNQSNFLRRSRKNMAPGERCIGDALKEVLGKVYELPCASTALRYLQRGRPTAASDVRLGFQAGLRAATLVIEGHAGSVIPPGEPSRLLDLKGYKTRNFEDPFKEALLNNWKALRRSRQR